MHNQVANMLTPKNSTPPASLELTPDVSRAEFGGEGRGAVSYFQTNPANSLLQSKANFKWMR